MNSLSVAGCILAALAANALGAPPEPAAPRTTAAAIFEHPAPPAPANPIDRIVFARLAALGIRPVLCSDAVFARRAYLDVLGTLPTAEEVRAFLDDPDSAQKRRRLIDRLLQRREFADYWAMKWGDVLRIKAEFPVNLWPNAAQAYHRWVRASIAENKPYDRFARELLTLSGSNFRVGPVNFYRALQNRTPEGIASAVALTFLGTRTDAWPRERLAGMGVFFSQVGYKPTREWKEEHVFWDPMKAVTFGPDGTPPASGGTSVPPAAPAIAVFPDGTKVKLPADRDPREVFADWLIRPENPWFARSVANRVWAWLLGRGIVEEPDDIRPDNPPSNPELLACLEKELIAGRYDLKRLYGLILNSQTYQLSSVPLGNNPQAEAQFARYPLRRLDAEVLIDTINKITGTTDLYTSAIPEPFTYIPQDQPAVALADGSITSPFLTLFGRSARATGMAGERSNKPVPGQWLHMLNSTHIRAKLEEGPRLRALLASGRKPAQIAEELYLTILSRRPTAEELAAVLAYGKLAAGKGAAPGKGGGKPGANARRDARPAAQRPPAVNNDWVDVAWALINSTEFLYRH